MDRHIRIGKVSSIDYTNGMIKVVYPDLDNSVTDDLPYLTFNNEYQMPCINDDVLVVHLSNGQAAGICAGTYWNVQNVPRASGKGVYRKEFNSESPNEAYLECESGIMTLHSRDLSLLLDGNLTVDVGSINMSADNISLEASGEITFKSSAGSITLSEIINHIK